MKKCILVFIPILFLTIPTNSAAQSIIGFEIQAYPAGIVPGIFFDYGLGNNSFISTRLAYNFTNRHDWGRHDSEKGGGPGFSLGYKYKNLFADNLSLQFRSDLWFMDINWEENSVPPCPTEDPCPHPAVYGISKGSSDVIVLQPTIGIGYRFLLTDQLYLNPTTSFGYEINIKTDGEEVGEGAIFLGGLNVGYSF